ncbi:hypothetical protein SAMN02927900_00601 [Rhizobium mongolense subsp. loessense]|uniref:Uncharacterized protein n=1 Tax=Rhizobium mongolense subsp. loessense TaxID=158890 RepID=A0A1G4PIY4_9HYPH|nr:hypothetical protein [Rhizobium mongolense]SCW32216.1 hypothetical protein SAMN02927900_00601 [Rhizobium mongolense subsp. loessense]
MMVTAEQRGQALERIPAVRLQLPADYKFDRNEASSRKGGVLNSARQ